ncbi:M-phase phosphoprotein 10 [Phyllostomus discolor]|uniref:M-phase phosphoprotein 10 n=1 Tax=Phyllostomus discolor TaxID=89673 RepID=A0A834DFE3_9CHIR|nr:M-phase phosphoprotein 10 [Phyllostomus discolor]
MAQRVWRQRTLKRCLDEVGKNTGRPECLLTIQDELASNFTSLTKVLYDFNKILENGRVRGSPLQKLVIDKFDDEQIWQQLELQNGPALQYFENAVSEALNDEDISLLPESEEQEDQGDGSEMEADGQEDLERHVQEEEEEGSDLSGDEPEGEETAKRPSKRGLQESPVFSDEDSDLDFDIGKLEQQSKMQNRVPRKPREKSIVDDKFFKLSEMETFLENMEKEEERKDDAEEEEIDLFEDVDSDEDEGGLFGSQTQKLKSGKSSRNLKYKDFFDPVESDEDTASAHDEEPGSEEEEEEVAEEGGDSVSESDEDNDLEEAEDDKPHKETSKRVTFALPDNEDMEDTKILTAQKDSAEVKSSFEKRQEKVTSRNLRNLLICFCDWGTCRLLMYSVFLGRMRNCPSLTHTHTHTHTHTPCCSVQLTRELPVGNAADFGQPVLPTPACGFQWMAPLQNPASLPVPAVLTPVARLSESAVLGTPPCNCR